MVHSPLLLLPLPLMHCCDLPTSDLGSARDPSQRTWRTIDKKCMPVQLRYLGCVLAWLAEENARSGGFAHGSLDLSSVGVVGHSRGAKLAALHLVGERAAGARIAWWFAFC